MVYRKISGIALISALLLSGCSPEGSPAPTPTAAPNPSTPTLLPTSTPTDLPTQTPTASATPFPYADFKISSPLEDMRLDELSDIITTTYQPPSPGMDDGHHGVDFAYWSRGTHEKMEGLGVFSIMPGVVAGITNDVPPYGNQIIIETKLSEIHPDFLTQITPVQALTPYPVNPRMPGCETVQSQIWEARPDSIYTLYGHLFEPVSLQIGDRVDAGQMIGRVGTTGASVNPHLHLELRWGPGGTKFASMGYYSTSVKEEERMNYCIWRVSGKFALLNPMDVINSWLNILEPGS